MDEPRDKEIQPAYQAFYIQSMLFNAIAAARSAQSACAMLGVVRENGTYEHLYGTRFLSELQNLVVNAGALSRYFWPAKADHRWRGVELRQAFGIGDDHALKERKFRNAIEHFDENLDNYLDGGVFGHILPEYIGPALHSGGTPTHIFRAFYVDTGKFQLLGETYDIQPVADAVAELCNQLVHMDSNGGMFGRGRSEASLK